MSQSLEEVLAQLTGKQIRAIVLKLWSAIGGREHGAEGVKRLLAGELKLQVVETGITGKRRDEIVKGYLAANEKGAAWGAKVRFLDNLNSIEEFEVIEAVIEEDDNELIQHYRERLTRWPDPKLPEGFAEKCPLVAKRLDTPQKVRIFLRGAEFRDVTPMLMGEVFQDILHRHEVKGEKLVVYPRYRGDKRCDAMRIVYHTQLQAWTLTNLLLGNCGKGTSTKYGLFIDWRTKAEQKAAGDRW